MISYLFACFYEDQTYTHLQTLIALFEKKSCEKVSLEKYFPREKPYSYCFEDPVMKEKRCLNFHESEEEEIIQKILERFQFRGCLNKKDNKFQALFNRGCFYEKKDLELIVSYQKEKKIFLRKKNYFKNFYFKSPYRSELLKKLNKTPLYVYSLPVMKKYLETRVVHGALCEEYLIKNSVRTLNECTPTYFIVDSVNEIEIELKLSSSKEKISVAFENFYLAVKKYSTIYRLGSLWPWEAWTK